jgi:alkanesulfonate monooxygenase SsuD/methylene tetrahydromethanopterin reductase-like flavin-dependent oxidoreductase (luciferase family)
MFKALCVGETAEYHGQHFQISGKVFYPMPLQKPHPPIWVGGRTGRAVRRTARLGDGWLPNGIGPDKLTAGRRTLRRLCEEGGRSPDSVQVGNCLAVHFGEAPQDQLPGRASLSGGAADIAQGLERFRDATTTRLIHKVCLKVAVSTVKITAARIRLITRLIAEN